MARPSGRTGETLVNRAVLGVDGQYLRAGRRANRLDQRGGRDQGLLVGERQAPPTGQCRHRHRQPREPDDRVHDDVGARRQCRQSLGSHQDLDGRPDHLAKRRPVLLARDPHAGHPELPYDCRELAQAPRSRYRHEIKSIRLTT
jgi:hypothetical protein